MAHQHSGGHHSADDQYLSTPEGSTFEHTDAHVSAIVKFMLWLALVAVLVHFGLGFVYSFLIKQAMPVGEPQYPLAATERQLPPAPQLQQFPARELLQLRSDEQNLLETYGWMDRNAGTVHIPIEDAMRLTVERGLPSASGELAQPSGVVEMPADSSAGRTMIQRRQ